MTGPLCDPDPGPSGQDPDSGLLSRGATPQERALAEHVLAGRERIEAVWNGWNAVVESLKSDESGASRRELNVLRAALVALDGRLSMLDRELTMSGR